MHAMGMMMNELANGCCAVVDVKGLNSEELIYYVLSSKEAEAWSGSICLCLKEI